MAIKRYVADADTTISNAFKPNLINRATGSNMGQADSMEIFSIYAQASTSSNELSRALVKFPISDIISDRSNSFLPASGSVNFYMRMFNAVHPFTVPEKFVLTIKPVSASWDEGYGLDCDEYSDAGTANWEKAKSSVDWTTDGGDYLSSTNFTASFATGIEDLEVNVTDLVEQWVAGTKSNYGVGIMLTSSIETATSSSYTKKFYARSSEYFFKRPILEARWNSSIADNRGSFFISSSLAPASDNLNAIYLYNYIRGRLTNIPTVSTGAIYVQVWSDSVSGSQLTSTPVTGGYVSTGIYSASFALNTTSSYVYDRWFGTGLTPTYHTGSIKTISINSLGANLYNNYVTSIPNIKNSYSNDEVARFRIFVRNKNWCPNIYTKMQTTLETEVLENSFYKIFRMTDNLKAVDYGTGSLNHTKLSYDVSGSYFDFDMGLLEPNYMYGMKFVYKINDNYHEQKEIFKFRVE